MFDRKKEMHNERNMKKVRRGELWGYICILLYIPYILYGCSLVSCTDSVDCRIACSEKKPKAKSTHFCTNKPIRNNNKKNHIYQNLPLSNNNNNNILIFN